MKELEDYVKGSLHNIASITHSLCFAVLAVLQIDNFGPEMSRKKREKSICGNEIARAVQ